MKKNCTCAIICSSGRDYVLIILFQFIYDSKAGLFFQNLFWVEQYDSATFIFEEELNQY